MNIKRRGLAVSLQKHKISLQNFVIISAFFVPQIAHAIEWSNVPGKDIVLFYPAQLSWEMLLTQSEHSGAKKFREGKDCRQCHEGEERASGLLLVADRLSETAPIENKPGFIEATIKAATDDERIYVHVEFEPGAQPHAGMDRDYETKIAVMLDDGGVAETRRGGCWAACHDNLARMPSGEAADTTKYLSRSRSGMTRTGGEDIKSSAALQDIRKNGGYLEYWQARLNRGAAPDVVDGFILESRVETPSPVVEAQSSFKDGRWSVTFSRVMKGEGLYKEFVGGKTYTFGISIHAGHTAQRFHYVSLEKTLVLNGGSADIVALQY